MTYNEEEERDVTEDNDVLINSFGKHQGFVVLPDLGPGIGKLFYLITSEQTHNASVLSQGRI